jgi:hypothetical protein
MNHLPDRMSTLRDSLFDKLATYGQKAGDLGQRVRKLVFGFRQRATLPTDRWTFSVKLLYDHKLVQRQRAFQQGGGEHSGMVRHALSKVRHHIQQP